MADIGKIIEEPAMETRDKIRPKKAVEVEKLVQGWVHDFIYGGPIARDVDSINALQAAIPELIKKLETHL
jgi:hypothetical protein